MELTKKLANFGNEILEAVRTSADETSVVLGDKIEENKLVVDCLSRLERVATDAIKIIDHHKDRKTFLRTRSALKGE